MQAHVVSFVGVRMLAMEIVIVLIVGAACAVAGYLASLAAAVSGTTTWKIEQGVEMGRPSELWVDIDTRAGAIAAVRLGGTAVRVGHGFFTLT